MLINLDFECTRVAFHEQIVLIIKMIASVVYMGTAILCKSCSNYIHYIFCSYAKVYQVPKLNICGTAVTNI